MRSSAGGFSLIELVMAISLTLAISAGVFVAVDAGWSANAGQPEIADMQQRLRVAALTLTRDLAGAGAGPLLALPAAPLIYAFPPVLPFREGAIDDPPGTFKSDVVSLIQVPLTIGQTTLRADLSPGVRTLEVAAQRNCPSGTNLCGFEPGATLVVYDDTGSYDVFTVAAVFDAARELEIASRPADSAATTFKAGARVSVAELRAYYLKTDPITQIPQLMRFDESSGAAAPVVDHVVSLRFEYFGDALSALAAGQLADGPWYPDAGNANRWDADLLRIRTIVATLRVQSAIAALRGPAGLLFATAGTSRGGAAWAPDLEVRLQVSPRNLMVNR